MRRARSITCFTTIHQTDGHQPNQLGARWASPKTVRSSSTQPIKPSSCRPVILGSAAQGGRANPTSPFQFLSSPTCLNLTDVVHSHHSLRCQALPPLTSQPNGDTHRNGAEITNCFTHHRWTNNIAWDAVSGTPFTKYEHRCRIHQCGPGARSQTLSPTFLGTEGASVGRTDNRINLQVVKVT